MSSTMGPSTLKYLAIAFAFLAPPALVVAAAVSVGSHIRGDDAARVSAEAAPNRGVSAISAISIDLGRIVCGDCCVGNVWGALGEMPGIQDIDIKAGQKTFTVFCDGDRVRPEQVVASLIAAGETGASLGAEGPDTGAAQSARRWVRTAKR